MTGDATSSRPPETVPPPGEAAPAATDPPAHISRYVVEGEIARGGMGVVYRATDPDFGRTLAVKLLLDDRRGDEAAARRFLEEARLCGQLQHPGIPPVHEMGTLPDGRPFFAMKLVKGDTLAALLARRAAPADDLPRFVGIFEQVCQTVAYAHSRGVIHRDLKPSNVMVGAFGEVQVMDWGLAKVLAAPGAAAVTVAAESSTLYAARGPGSPEETAPGSILGTPAFMPPEQARGQVSHLDERADVFALGGLLCVILTGRTPYASSDPRPALERAAEGDTAAALARLEGCGADEELIRLAQTCLAFKPSDRPRDAAAVAAYRAGVEQRLRQAEVARAAAEVRAAEERKRRRLTLVLVATVFLAVLGAAAGALWMQSERTRQQTEAQRQAADLERHVTEDLNDLALHQERGEWVEARQAAERAGARLGSAGPEALRQRVAGARAELERREARVQRDRDMRRTLEDLRLPPQSGPTRPAARWPEVDAAYRRAFAQYGLDLTTLSAEEAGWRVRDSAIGETLVAALDHWAFLCLESDRARLRQVLAVAQRADPDRRRQDLREAILREDKEALARLARDPRAAELPPATLVLLGRALFKLRLEPEALRVLGDGQRRHPGDLWLTLELAYALSSLDPPRAADAEKFWRAALALRPDSLALHINLARTLNMLGNRAEEEAIYRTALLRHPDDPDSLFGLGNCLSHQGKYADAEALLRRSLLLRPDDPLAWYNLGNVRLKQHRPVEAEAAYREALRLKPEYPEAHCNLGSALADQGKPAEAERECRTALRQNPDLAMGHYNLGNYLWRRGRRGEALDEYRAAVRLDPDYADAHNNLGAALVEMGRFPEAEKVLREAVRRKPDNPHAHCNLGNALADLGKSVEAEECYREAIRLDPDFDQAHYNYGRLLNAQGRTAEAEASYRKAIRANPKYPEAHCNLGLLLATQGRFREAIGFVRRGHELSAGVPGWRYPSALWVKEIGEWAEVDARLSAILKGEEPPRDAERLVALARLCQVYKKRYAAACRLYAAAFAARPALADDLRAEHRYNAACVAALAAAGQGADAAGLADKERARLREQALGWLRADLDAWARRVGGGKAADRQAAQGKMRHWQGDPDLSGVRHPWSLSRLPADERRQWQKLWADVEALHARCGDGR